MTDQVIGKTLASKFQIKEYWRANSVSQTYHAIQITIGKPLTIKRLNPALAQYADVANSLQTEAHILSRIANPFILNVLDIDKDETGASFLVLENAEGRSLREFIRDEGGSSLERTVVIIRQIADALTIAHSNNIVHGNLSSDNLLIARRGDTDFVKVLDFGALQESQLDDEKTIVRADLPFYKSPEQLSEAETIDARTDIYALGIILFEVLTGKPPFVDENPRVLADKHLRDIPPSLIAVRPDLPPQVEQVLQRSLAKQPNQRFQSAAEFSEALVKAAQNALSGNAAYPIAHQTAEFRPTPITEQQITANNPYKTAFIVLIGIVALSVLAIYTTGGFRNTPTQANSDPAAQPVQPLNPASSNGEDLGNLNLQSLGNSNIDPSVVAPGSVPPGGMAPPMGGGIPPGLYPNGQTIVVPGNSNSIFMGDLNSNVAYPVNSNLSRGANANIPANANIKPTAGNTNTAPVSRPANSNVNSTNANSTATPIPVPTTAPTQRPTPRVVAPTPNAAPVKPNGATESLVKSAPSGAN